MLFWLRNNRFVPRILVVKLIFALGVFTLYPLEVEAGRVRVRGYYRKDGTYVRPHYRTTPDGNPYNNYSFPGNYNPNTGKNTQGNPDTYLNRYYNESSSSYITPSIDFDNWLKDLGSGAQTRTDVNVQNYFRKDGTYVRPHYRTIPDGNPYNNYSFPGNYNPNTGKNTPRNTQNYQSKYSQNSTALKTYRSTRSRSTGHSTIKTITSKAGPKLRDVKRTVVTIGGKGQQTLRNVANGTFRYFQSFPLETENQLRRFGLVNLRWAPEFRYLTLKRSFHSELAFWVSPQDNTASYRFGFGIRSRNVAIDLQYARDLTDSLRAGVGFMNSKFGAGLELHLVSDQLILSVEGVKLTSGYPELNAEISVRFFQNASLVIGSEDWFGERHWTTGVRFLFL